MTPDYERLENLIARFPWNGRNGLEWEHTWSADRNGLEWEHTWSVDRNAIDTDFYFDSVLRDFGNEVKFDKIFTHEGICLAITMGEWLYFGSKEELKNRSKTALLRRIKWSAIEISDVEDGVTVLTVNDNTEES